MLTRGGGAVQVRRQGVRGGFIQVPFNQVPFHSFFINLKLLWIIKVLKNNKDLLTIPVSRPHYYAPL